MEIQRRLLTRAKDYLALFSQKGRKSIPRLLFALVALLVLGYIVYRQKDVLLDFEWNISPGYLLIAFIFYSIALFWSSLIWSWIVHSLGGKVPLATHLYYNAITHMTKRLPGTVWYIAGRGVLYQNMGIPYQLISIASGIEFVLIIMAGILISYIFSISILVSYHISLILPGAVFLLSLALVHPRVIAWFFYLFKLEAPEYRFFNIAGWLISYAILWILGGCAFYAVTRAIYPLQIQAVGYVIGSWTVVGILSSLFLFFPSNMGVTEIGLSLLLTKIMPSSIAVIVVVICRILFTLFDVTWGIIWFLVKNRNN